MCKLRFVVRRERNVHHPGFVRPFFKSVCRKVQTKIGWVHTGRSVFFSTRYIIIALHLRRGSPIHVVFLSRSRLQVLRILNKTFFHGTPSATNRTLHTTGAGGREPGVNHRRYVTGSSNCKVTVSQNDNEMINSLYLVR